MIKMLICDFDGTLYGGPSQGVDRFTQYLGEQAGLDFVIATGRTLPSIREGLTTENYPSPHTIISDVGTQIHHGQELVTDATWQEMMHAIWDKPAILSQLEQLDFLGMGEARHQGDFKITYEGKLNPQQCGEVESALRDGGIEVDLLYSHEWFLDITPKDFNKASAIHYLMKKYGLQAHEICVAGDSANDAAMLTISGVNAILVANHYEEVAHLSDLDQVYTSSATHAEGVLEGLQYWQAMC